MASTSLLTIPNKPDSPISHTFIPATTQRATSAPTLLLFLNGLARPASSWLPSIRLLQDAGSVPAMLTYDRFGQGFTTSRDPLDGTAGKENGHDFLDVANDLHEIVKVVAIREFGLTSTDVDEGKLQLLLVGASIGAAIARLYTEHHPGLVAGIILLDSNIANCNYSDFWPDPDSAGFDPAAVEADDCSLEQYRVARKAITSMFDLGAKNAESLDRSTSPRLLPNANSPRLFGIEGRGPWLRVVGHDPFAFAEKSYLDMRTPRSCSMRFTNRHWAKYNESLTNITEEGRCDGVIIAKGCGHFIQLDDPKFVATEITRMLCMLETEKGGQ